jgi:hypothetical protein
MLLLFYPVALAGMWLFSYIFYKIKLGILIEENEELKELLELKHENMLKEKKLAETRHLQAVELQQSVLRLERKLSIGGYKK